jgi:flavin-dependent dehydrogenase
MNIKKVTIIGGGSSGWMAAATLIKLCPHLDVHIVESKNFPTIGVGESTLGHINRWLSMLGITDDMWMKDCKATYKNTIRFTNFRQNDGSYFEYPFGDWDPSYKHNGVNSWSEIAAAFPDEFPPESFAEFMNTSNTFLAKHNRQTKNEDDILRHFNFQFDTAYHMDATAFGQWLKHKYALPKGVNLIQNDVVSYEKDEQGNITKIFCEDGLILESDLWIDCTGFKSLLLEQWMGQKFIDFKSQLANDSAWAGPIQIEDRINEIQNTTNCTALGNGWVWNTPLWSRIGTGYVFSSKFTDKDSALLEFKTHLKSKYGEERVEATDFRHIDIKHGYREKCWVKNVVGIGLSYGFIEPLESTGLLTTHENLIRLSDILNRRNGYVSHSEKQGFNFTVENILLGFRDFVAMHYAFSMRTDTPYWRWCTQENDYRPEIFDRHVLKEGGWVTILSNLTLTNTYPENMPGATFITAGLGIKSVSTKEITETIFKLHKIDTNLLEEEKQKYYEYKNNVEAYIKTLPTHYQFLLDNIYGDDEYAKKV